MSIKKQFSRTKPTCKVTFILQDGSCSKAYVTGEFNNWDTQSMPMKKAKSGEFKATVELERGKEYRFKYIIDDKEWINEKEADRFELNEFKSENSVIVL